MCRKETAPYRVLGAVGIFPAEGDEADGDGVEEFSTVEAVSDLGHGVYICCELDSLEENLALTPGPSPIRWARVATEFRYQCAAEGEDDVAVLVGILKDGVALVGIEFPAGGGDDFGVAIEGFVGRDEVEDGTRSFTRIARIFTKV
jgi:hypothetical protein